MAPVASNLTGPSAIPSASVPTVPGLLPTKYGKNAPTTKSSSDDYEREVICIDSDEEMGTLSASGSTVSTEAGTGSDQSFSSSVHSETLDTEQVLEEASYMMSDSETRKKAISAIKALASSWTNEPDNTNTGHVAARASAKEGTGGVSVPKGEPPLLPKVRITSTEAMLKKQEGHTPQEAAVAQALAGFVHFQRRLCKDLHLSPAKPDSSGSSASAALPVSPSAVSGVFSASSGTRSNLLCPPVSTTSGRIPTPSCVAGLGTSTAPAKPVLAGSGTILEHSVTSSGTLHIPSAVATPPAASTTPSTMAALDCRTSSAPGTIPGQTNLVPTAYSCHRVSTTTSATCTSPTSSLTCTPTPSVADVASSSATSRGFPLSIHSVPPIPVTQFSSTSSSAAVSIAESAGSKSPLQALIVHHQSTNVAGKADACRTSSLTLSTGSVKTTTTGSHDCGSLSTIATHNQTRHT